MEAGQGGEGLPAQCCQEQPSCQRGESKVWNLHSHPLGTTWPRIELLSAHGGGERLPAGPNGVGGENVQGWYRSKGQGAAPSLTHLDWTHSCWVLPPFSSWA